MELMMMAMDESISALVNDSRLQSSVRPADRQADRPATPSGKPSKSNQQTLASSFMATGVGLHSGASVQVRVMPAPEHMGRVFVRMDVESGLHTAVSIKATVGSVTTTRLSTELGNGTVTIRTVEHLLAALVAMGVDNALIEVDGPELPLLDGSAKGWTDLIAQAGLQAQTAQRSILKISDPLWCHHGDAFVAALPAAEPRFTYGIDFPVVAIGNQWHSWSPQQESFTDAIAPARTFALAHQIEQLREQGLIKGGSLDNAIVCDDQLGWLNPPLRFANEPVRHKLLDLLGDLSLIGTLPCAHVLAYKASHALHTEFAQRLVASYDNTQ